MTAKFTNTIRDSTCIQMSTYDFAVRRS